MRFNKQSKYFQLNSISIRPPMTTKTPSQFSSSESAIHQTNSIQNELEHKTSYVFLKFIDFIKFQNNFKFTSTFPLKQFQIEINSESMFVSKRHLTSETRWMGSTGGGTFFYTFSKKNLKSWPKPVQKRGP